MKKIFLMVILLIPLVLVLPQMGNAGDPVPPGSVLCGPPVVGTLTIDLLGPSPGGYSYMAEISACCADCFDKCRASCNFRITRPFESSTSLEDLKAFALQNFHVGNSPKQCFSREGGELLMIVHLSEFVKSDLNNDGYFDRATAKVILFYAVPLELCPYPFVF
jgi:hypothetical protein